MAKSLEEKERDKRIQKQVEKLGGPKKPPKPKTLKQAADEQYKRARIIQKAPFTSMDKKTTLTRAGFKPASYDEAKTAFYFGRAGLYKKNVPKQLRDRLKYEGGKKGKTYTPGSGSRKPDMG
jgi:hypothetical protein